MFSEGVLHISLYKNATLETFLYAALYPMNSAVIFQDRFLNRFLDRKAAVNQERSIVRFKRMSITTWTQELMYSSHFPPPFVINTAFPIFFNLNILRYITLCIVCKSNCGYH